MLNMVIPAGREDWKPGSVGASAITTLSTNRQS